MNATTPLLLLLSAPSGGGKTTLCDQLLRKRPDITRVITCTSRPKRPGEIDGVDYYFLSRSDFYRRIAEGAFLEYATVYDNSYGTLRSEVVARIASGRHVLLNIDVQGAAAVRLAAQADALLSARLVTVFLTPATKAELETRLSRRGSETPAALARRLEEAASEVRQWNTFDYLIISTTIAEDVRRMEVILEAELYRKDRSVAPAF